MSLASMAIPGAIRTLGGGAGITPESLFRSTEEKAAYEKILNQSKTEPGFKVKKVKVEIFDLSDDESRDRYEKLWAELLEKSGRMEVLVDHRKDLVHRSDGTSYWMKYVEYVEFGDDKEDGKKDESAGK